MLAHGYSILGEKTGPILLPLVGLTAGREADGPADEMQMDFEFFKILYRLFIQVFILFVITAMLLQY